MPIPNGKYATWNDIYSIVGAGAIWDINVSQKAIDEADADIISVAFDSGFYAIPLEPHGSDIERVRKWSAILAASKLVKNEKVESMLTLVREDMKAAFSRPDGLNATKRETTPVMRW